MRTPVCVLEINYQANGVADDSARFRAACEWVAAEFGLERLEVSIGVVDDRAIQALNREHLAHDWPTDVISFVFEREDTKVDGEIIASAETAKRLSQSADWSPEDELLLYIIHGLLHLAGLDDIELDEQAAMRDAERRCLMDLGVAGAESHVDRWGDIA